MSKKHKVILCQICKQDMPIEEMKIRPLRGALTWVCGNCWVDKKKDAE